MSNVYDALLYQTDPYEGVVDYDYLMHCQDEYLELDFDADPEYPNEEEWVEHIERWYEEEGI